jgi:hypothetical protein
MRIALALVLLVGCAPSARQIAARQEADRAAMLQAQAQVAREHQAAEDACLLRFPDGAAQAIWDACMRDEGRRQEAIADARRESALNAAIADRQTAALEAQAEAARALKWQIVANQVQQLNQQITPAPVAQPQPQTVNCYSVPVYGTGAVNTTCR